MIRFFRHYIPLNIFLMVAVEALILILAIYVGVSLRFIDVGGTLPSSIEPLFPKALIFALVMIFVMTAFGLYDYWEWEGGVRGMVLRLVASFVTGFLLMGLLFYLVPDLFLGRGVVSIAFVTAMAGVTLARLVIFKWSTLDVLKRRVLVLGTGSRAARIDAQLRSSMAGQSLHIVGYLPLNGTHHYVDHAQILPDSMPLPQIADKYNVEEIIIAIRDRRGGGLPVDELLECKLMGVKISELSTFFERETGQLQLESLNASWIILSEGFRVGLGRDIVKRAFDIVASLCLLLLTFPIMVIAAIAILVESGSPIFYRQEREGQSGRVFPVLKFRSMRTDAEKDGKPQWAAKNDDRTTRVGRFIRKVRIDELPQIFNVLKGDMSFVGPRPERPFFVEKLAKEIPYYNVRHTVKPGITGWAQIRCSYGASVEDSIEKLQYDLYYVKNHSLFLDLLILFQTAQVVLWGKGAR
jgi:sugar transferase (PEP-CTERM system associated)